ncbi:MAG TPA: ferrochelatase, partial [Gammaproteobacteria bacterium]|nr:ferrochelatase [Gammaproteobacteria bacterium]
MQNHKNTGVLLINLGTPDAPEPVALRRYLAEFLSDPRVVDRNPLLWKLVLHGVILRIRPRRSAHAYKKVWLANGSPLLIHSQQLATHLADTLKSDSGSSPHIALGMRYGTPSIKQALTELQQAGISRLIVLPLYPQYSATTTATSFDAIARVFKNWRQLPELHFI